MKRTCSEYPIDDCKKANNNHFCYCNRPLCNGENAESIIEKYGDIEEADETDTDSEADEEDGSGSEPDGDFYNYRSTGRVIETTEATTEANKFAVLSVSPSLTNKAVNSHLCEITLIFVVVVISHFIQN